MIHPPQRINMNYPTAGAEWNVDGAVVGSLQAVGVSDAAWGTATVILYRSNNRTNWETLPTPQTLGPGNFMSLPFDIEFAYLRAEIVADEAADEYVVFTLWTGGQQ